MKDEEQKIINLRLTKNDDSVKDITVRLDLVNRATIINYEGVAYAYQGMAGGRPTTFKFNECSAPVNITEADLIK